MAHELRKRKKPPQEQLDSGDALQPSPQKKPRARAAASKKDAGVNSSTSTGGGAAGTSLQGTPALSSNTDSTQSSSVFDVRLQDLPPPNPAARGLEAFRKGLQSGTIRLKPDAPHEFTPPTGLPRHIEAFPKIRDYRLLKGELQQYTILVGGKISTPKAADGSRKAVYADSHPVKVWRIKAQWRRADKPTQTIDYFVRPANYKTPQQAAITSAVCPTLEDATRLGQLVVDYTNKLPGDFNADDWVFSPGTNNIPNYSSGFLEVAALQAYSPEMDLAAALGEGFAPSADGKGIYRHLRHNSRNITSKNKTGKAANALTTRSTNKMACCLELVADDKVQPAQRSLSTLDDDFLAGVTVPPIPVSHAPFLGYIDGTSTDQALRSVHDRCQSVLFGTIGTNSQIKNMWDQERSKYQKLSTAGSQRADGIFNNLRLFSKSSTPAEISGGRRLELAAAAVCSALDFKLDKQTRRIPGAYFITASNNRILHSYILQQVVDSLSRKEGLMKAILKGHEAAFEVDTSLVRAPDVIRAALVNKDVVPIDSVVVCMHCPNVLLEVDAFLDDAGRRLCFPCSRLAHDAGSDVSSTVTVRSWSRRILRISINEDLAAGASKIDKELVCRALQTQIISDTEWISASSPGVKSITSAKWELGLNSTDPQLLAGRLMRFKHMDQPSVGKLMPMIVVGKKTHLHYADNDPIHQNVFLQTLEENHLQGTHTSGSQPVIAEAAQVAKILPPVTDQPSLEYPHEHRAFYNKFHRVALNDLMIIRSFPYTRKGRISQTAIKAADMPRLRRMWKRCNWDGKKMHRSQDFVITRAGMRNFNSTTRHDRTERQRFPPWEGSNFERIKQNVATIVAPGGRFNKHGLELLQNPDGSYWLGLPEERPEDADWEFEHREAEARLHNDTLESDETILYENLIQFIRTGGKCHGLKFRLSVITGRLEVYSLGRGTHRRDEAGNILDIIGAREPLRTGCTLLHPTDLNDPAQYDFSRVTIVRESLLLNKARHDFPLPNNDLSPIIDRICAISLDPRWADPPMARAEDYYDAQLPKSWKALAIAQASEDPPVSVEEVDQAFMSAQELVGVEDVDEFDDCDKTFGEDVERAQLKEDFESTFNDIEQNDATLYADAYVQELKALMARAIESSDRQLLYSTYREQLMRFLDDGDRPSRKTIQEQFDDLKAKAKDEFADLLDAHSESMFSELTECVKSDDVSRFRDLEVLLLAYLGKKKSQSAPPPPPPENCFDCGVQVSNTDAYCTTEGHEDRKLHFRCVPFIDSEDLSTWRCKDCRSPAGERQKPPPAKCFDCGVQISNTDAYCTTDGHEDRKLHFRCVPFINPEDLSTWRCKDCRLPAGNQQKPSDVPRVLNMKNIGNSCYMSSSIQLLHQKKPLRDLIMDSELDHGMIKTGRAVGEWLPSHFKFDNSTSEAMLLDMLRKHMEEDQRFVMELRRLFKKLDQVSRPLQYADVQTFFDALTALLPGRFQPKAQEDANDMLSLVLDAVFLPTDNSSSNHIVAYDRLKEDLQLRGIYCALCEERIQHRVRTPCCGRNYCRQHIEHYMSDVEICPGCDRPCPKASLETVTELSADEMQHARQLRPLGVVAADQAIANRSRGLQSRLYAQFFLQIATEWQCQQADCDLIGRTISNIKYLELNFIDVEDRHTQKNSLASMLEAWHVDRLEAGNRIFCVSGMDTHAGTQTKVSRITSAPPFFHVRFPRFGEAITIPVDLPEYLDNSPYADAASLPSDQGTPPKLIMEPIYRLSAVNIYYSHGIGPDGQSRGHYVLYTVQDGVWICLDDSCGKQYATAEHPQVAFNNGGVAYFAVYERIRDKTALPFEKTGTHSTGHLLRKGRVDPGAKLVEPLWERPKTGPSFSCHLCNNSFPDDASLANHKPECKLVCNECKLTFTDKKQFEAHIAQCKPPPPETETERWQREERIKIEAKLRQEMEKEYSQKLADAKEKMRREMMGENRTGDAEAVARLRSALEAERERNVTLIGLLQGQVDMLRARNDDIDNQVMHM